MYSWKIECVYIFRKKLQKFLGVCPLFFNQRQNDRVPNTLKKREQEWNKRMTYRKIKHNEGKWQQVHQEIITNDYIWIKWKLAFSTVSIIKDWLEVLRREVTGFRTLLCCYHSVTTLTPVLLCFTVFYLALFYFFIQCLLN